MRLLLLTDDEAAFVGKAIETWTRIYQGEEGPEMDAARANRFNVQRKLEGKYTEREVQEAGEVALGMMG